MLQTICPFCGRVNIAHDGPTPESQPKDGDVSLCWGCRRPAFYVNTPLGVGLRVPTADEQLELDEDPQLRQTLAAMSESFTPAQASELRWGQA